VSAIPFLALSALFAAGSPVPAARDASAPAPNPSLKLRHGVVEVDLSGGKAVRVEMLDLDGRFVQELSATERMGSVARYPLPQPAKEGRMVVRVRAAE